MKRAGTAQAELARSIGVSDSTVSRWLTGRSAQPDHTHARKTGAVLGDVDGALRAAGYIDEEAPAESDNAPPQQGGETVQHVEAMLDYFRREREKPGADLESIDYWIRWAEFGLEQHRRRDAG